MALRTPGRLAVAACMGLSAIAAVSGTAQAAPPPLAAVADSPNQQLADAIAQKLSANAQLAGYQVEVTCDHGVVELNGSVKDAAQATEIIKVVRSVKGVTKIVDRMTPGAVKPVQAVESVPPPAAAPQGVPQGMPQGMPVEGMHGVPQGMPQGLPMESIGGGMQGCPPGGCPSGGCPSGGMGGAPYGGGAISGGMYGGDGSDPMPIGGNTGGLYNSGPPKMPPYAWPTYAPHNNYSRVAYPQQYPANAFPFIGPFYPFPKVPPGYRAIKLEWEDGSWYYGRTATKRNWWSIRYW